MPTISNLMSIIEKDCIQKGNRQITNIDLFFFLRDALVKSKQETDKDAKFLMDLEAECCDPNG